MPTLAVQRLDYDLEEDATPWQLPSGSTARWHFVEEMIHPKRGLVGRMNRIIISSKQGDSEIVRQAARQWRTKPQATNSPGECVFRDAPRFGIEGSSTNAESDFLKLGCRFGAGAAEREASLQRWAGRGVDGARWLIKRLRSETNVERISDVSHILASSRRNLGAILEEAQKAATRRDDHMLEVMLQVLGWLTVPKDDPDRPIANLLLATAQSHVSQDIRETAYTALRCLGPESAQIGLRNAAALERSTELRETIELLLKEMGQAGPGTGT